MAYTLGNKYAKNLCKRLVLLQLIIKNVVTCFFGTQCSSPDHSAGQDSTQLSWQLSCVELSFKE